jgi:hypothetical protein
MQLVETDDGRTLRKIKVDGVSQLREAFMSLEAPMELRGMPIPRYVPKTSSGEHIVEFIGGDMEIITGLGD